MPQPGQAIVLSSAFSLILESSRLCWTTTGWSASTRQA